MLQFLKEKIEKLKDISEAISNQIKKIENTPEYLLPTRFNAHNDELHSLIIKFYAHLGHYHRDVATLYGGSNAFPASSSGLTEVVEVRDDYIKIKMPLLCRKDKSDSILVNDLDAAFWEAQKNGAKIPNMNKKEITFTFCYSADTEKTFIRDNDNYAIRRIINAIVRNIGSTDDGEITRLSLQTIVKENIENHTVIEVKRLI